MSDYLSCSFLGCPKCPDTLDLISGPAAGVTHTLINQTKGDYHSMDHDEFSRKLNEIKERVLSSSTPEGKKPSIPNLSLNPSNILMKMGMNSGMQESYR